MAVALNGTSQFLGRTTDDIFAATMSFCIWVYPTSLTSYRNVYYHNRFNALQFNSAKINYWND